MSAQLRLIRSRYKAMCASLGVRPRLQPAVAPSSSPPGVAVADGPGGTIEGPTGGALATAAVTDSVRDPGAAEAGTEKRRQKTVWPLAGPASASLQGLSF
jgi:hypothetical protein